MTGLTDRQREVLALIAKRTLAGGSRTIRELGRHLGISINGVSDLLNAVERKGCIKRDAKLSRGIHLTLAGWEEALVGLSADDFMEACARHSGMSCAFNRAIDRRHKGAA